MNNEITPPPELVQEWYDAARGPRCEQELATQAAHWGADRELQAIEDYISGHGKWFASPKYRLAELRAARRPKPLSQADLALEALDAEDDAWPIRSLEKGQRFNTIRAALKRLKELEQANSQPS